MRVADVADDNLAGVQPDPVVHRRVPLLGEGTVDPAGGVLGVERCGHRLLPVTGHGEWRPEDREDLVADELHDGPVVAEDHGDDLAVVDVEDVTHLGRAPLRRHRGEPAQVAEEHGDLGADAFGGDAVALFHQLSRDLLGHVALEEARDVATVPRLEHVLEPDGDHERDDDREVGVDELGHLTTLEAGEREQQMERGQRGHDDRRQEQAQEQHRQRDQRRQRRDPGDRDGRALLPQERLREHRAQGVGVNDDAREAGVLRGRGELLVTEGRVGGAEQHDSAVERARLQPVEHLARGDERRRRRVIGKLGRVVDRHRGLLAGRDQDRAHLHAARADRGRSLGARHRLIGGERECGDHVALGSLQHERHGADHRVGRIREHFGMGDSVGRGRQRRVGARHDTGREDRLTGVLAELERRGQDRGRHRFERGGEARVARALTDEDEVDHEHLGAGIRDAFDYPRDQVAGPGPRRTDRGDGRPVDTHHDDPVVANGAGLQRVGGPALETGEHVLGDPDERPHGDDRNDDTHRQQAPNDPAAAASASARVDGCTVGPRPSFLRLGHGVRTALRPRPPLDGHGRAAPARRPPRRDCRAPRAVPRART